MGLGFICNVLAGFATTRFALQQQQQQPPVVTTQLFYAVPSHHQATHLLTNIARNEPATAATGLYIHIPFCRKRCRYCDFAIVPVGPEAMNERSSFLQMARNYTNAVLSELSHTKTKSPVQLQSVYFGGGTPSLAPIDSIQALVSAIRSNRNFQIAPNAEWTIEIDPGTFDLEKLCSLKELGFNRFSLGVQSFDDATLASIGRTHRRQDIFDSIAMLLQVFGENVNYSIDLISALPGLSLAQWTHTLETAVSLHPRPKHLSVYDLQIERGTVFGNWYKNGDDDTGQTPTRLHSDLPSSRRQLALPTDADAAFMYRYASGYLAARGYEHYEVSSYAMLPSDKNKQPQWRSKHNQIYWAVHGQWYAFGLGATSFVDHQTQARPRTLFDYYQWVKELSCSNGGDSANNDDASNRSSDLDLLQDICLKRLRTMEGLDLDCVHDRFGGKRTVDAIMKGAALGIEIGIAKRDGQFLRLTDPNGLLFSNTIISSIFVELEEVFDD
ncbi:hypothetical protein MPSEU_000693300 [Mayamaea pseudoterrestris]|nr:hypothetical protein MPSEU_000693300 [Mayamaea pseudoterrestris]